ncbi:hypothetical protein ACFQGT_12835 [Natrialbaceae archaeon GCM10025810]|uniref:COG1470 family protein n=1 Tax=Halovalidus salilacus TaxID=3075124 RepID=UPI00361A7DE0
MRRVLSVLLGIALLVGSLPTGVVGLESSAAPSIDDRSGDASAAIEPRSVAEPSPTIAAATAPASATASTDRDDVLHREIVLRHRPDDPGVFEAEVTVSVPEQVSRLEMRLEEAAKPGVDVDVESTDGFEERSDDRLTWDEETREPTVRFTVTADRTRLADRQPGEADRRGAAGFDLNPSSGSGDEKYVFADAGSWAVVPVPGIGLEWSTPESDPVGTDETVEIDGPGATGGEIAYFGDVEEYERETDRGTIRLVVPEAADLVESPEAILDSLEAASDSMDVGAHNEETFVLAAPTGEVEWAQAGIQYGDDDAWVVDDARLDEARNVWLHEYVHTRQHFVQDVETTTETRWLVEAQAEYAAALLSLEQGLIDYREFSAALERGEEYPYADGVLADPSTWDDEDVDYVKGALVYGELDRQLRLATDGDRTNEDLLRELNRIEEGEELTEERLYDLVEELDGPDRKSVEKYAQTTATPEMWDGADHEAAFDQPVAQFEYGVADDPLEVRDASIDLEGADELAMPVGEPLSVPVDVENVGDREGTFDATLLVDGRIVDADGGTLAPGDGERTALSWTPSEPGTYDLRVGNDRLTVHARGPSSATVTDLSADPERVAPGEDVTVTATVENGDVHAVDRLEFRTARGVDAEPLVALAPGETTTVPVTLRFDDSSRYEVVAGDRKTEVTVRDDPIGAVADEVPGFGPLAAGIALAVALSARAVARRP